MNELIEIRNMVVNMGIPCEILGKFLWVVDENRKHDKILKKLGFKFSTNKARYYYTITPFTKKTEKQFTYEELQEMYSKNKLVVNQ